MWDNLAGASGSPVFGPSDEGQIIIGKGVLYGNGSGLWGVKSDSTTLGGYLPTDFVLLTTLTAGGYLRITSGAVTSNSMPGTLGEYRRSTTNAYFHDGSQWVTWSVSTNF